MTLNALDLFSGIGGFSLAAESVGFRTVAFCEIEPYPTRVLRRHFPGVPVFPDVKELTADVLADAIGERAGVEVSNTAGQERSTADARSAAMVRRGNGSAHAERAGTRSATRNAPRIDLICGGFPCQDISYAGKGAGLAGSRSGLFYEVIRLIRDMGPRYVLLENVAGLLTRGVGDVLGALAEVGYDAEWCCVRASDVGAPHRRDRIWILAYPQGAFTRPVHIEYVESHLTPFGSGDEWRTPDAGMFGGNGRGEPMLPQQAKAQTWPTATASDAWANNLDRSGMSGKHNLGLGTAVRNGEAWPTPSAGGETGGPHGLGGGSGHAKMLYDALPEAEARGMMGGSLNPDWVDALMGYPVGYTLPEGEPVRELPGVWPNPSPLYDNGSWATPVGSNAGRGQSNTNARDLSREAKRACRGEDVDGAQRWPAGLGAPQHAWEPPRLTTVKENRAARLKALGNSIVPHVARLWMQAIVEFDGVSA